FAASIWEAETRIRLAPFFLILLAPMLVGARPADDGRWLAGVYSFSDELGKFRIISVSGFGSKTDPVVIVEEFREASPATMVIRIRDIPRPYTYLRDTLNGFVHFEFRVMNASGHAWIGFEFELQELMGLPSVYGDGLSFDQRRTDSDTIRSDVFPTYERDFEPGDRIVFKDGAVDHGGTARFRFLVTDFTPKSEFYLVQDPRIPLS